jgi:hypothetical protein
VATRIGTALPNILTRVARFALILALCVFAGISPGVVQGEILRLNQTFSGDDPVGTSPWVKITFTQQTQYAVTVTVDFPAQAADASKSEFLSDVYLNLDPNLPPSLLSIAQNGGVAFSSATTHTNAFKADGDGYYDIDIAYPTTNAGRLTTGASSSFTITDGVPLSIDAFNYPSVGGAKGAFYTAVHVQGIPGADSGWIGASSGLSPSPEPSTFFLLLGGAISLLGFARWRRTA